MRADMARLTARAFEGFEIKSQRDTLSRLRNQAEIYNLVFTTATLVAAGKHIDKAAAVLPTWWGLIEAVPNANGVQFNTLRVPSVNPSASAERIAGFLWKDEALAALQSLGATRGLSRLRLAEAHALLAQSLNIDDMRALVFRVLQARRDWIDRHDPFFMGPFRPRTTA